MNRDQRRDQLTRAAKKADHTSPLRRIVDYVEVPLRTRPDLTITKEVLECGHIVSIKHDMHGETNAYRRRCKACAVAALQPHQKRSK